MMFKTFLSLILLVLANPARARELTVSLPWTSALQISPVVRYTQASVFGEGEVPTLRGFGYGAEFDYTIGTMNLSMGPYLSYVLSSLQNSANNSSQKEKFDGVTGAVGLKLYTDDTYLKIGIAQTKIKDRATGTVNNSRDYKSTGIEVGGGLNYIYSETFSAGLGLEMTYYKFDKNSNNLANRLDYLSYGIGLSLRFAIPSISPKER